MSYKTIQVITLTCTTCGITTHKMPGIYTEFTLDCDCDKPKPKKRTRKSKVEVKDED